MVYRKRKRWAFKMAKLPSVLNKLKISESEMYRNLAAAYKNQFTQVCDELNVQHSDRYLFKLTLRDYYRSRKITKAVQLIHEKENVQDERLSFEHTNEDDGKSVPNKDDTTPTIEETKGQHGENEDVKEKEQLRDLAIETVYIYLNDEQEAVVADETMATEETESEMSVVAMETVYVYVADSEKDGSNEQVLEGAKVAVSIDELNEENEISNETAPITELQKQSHDVASQVILETSEKEANSAVKVPQAQLTKGIYLYTYYNLLYLVYFLSSNQLNPNSFYCIAEVGL
jgi:hypothetical protein